MTSITTKSATDLPDAETSVYRFICLRTGLTDRSWPARTGPRLHRDDDQDRARSEGAGSLRQKQRTCTIGRASAIVRSSTSRHNSVSVQVKGRRRAR
jgi:hypothetical protein